MSAYQDFSEGSDLQIEVEGTQGTSSSGYSSQFFRAMQTLAQAIVQQVNQIPKERRPAEFSVNFALKALPEGGFAISLGEGSANFRISFKWQTEPVSALLGSPVIPGMSR